MSRLIGRRIVVTRAARQAGPLTDALKSRGAIPLAYPCIEIAPPEDDRPLRQALRDAGGGAFNWVIFTSANAVDSVSKLASEEQSGDAVRTPYITSLPLNTSLRVACIGEVTAQAAREKGWRVDLSTHHSSLVTSLPHGARVLLPQSVLAEDSLARALIAGGAQVTAVTAYRTIRASGGVDLPELLSRGEVDALTLASGSAARFLIERVQTEGGDMALLAAVPAACLGPSTAKVARDAGLRVAAVAAEPSVAGLVAALETLKFE